MKVPFLDLSAQYKQIQHEIDAALRRVLDNTSFAGGPAVTQFEQEYSAYCQCAHTVGVGSGTEALWVALIAMNIGGGDEVITVPNSFIATAEAISFCGAKPVFVDIDEQTYTMNPELIEAAITPRTKAIIPVHLYGQTADMDPILDIAKRHGLHVIEDAAQAHGALYKGRPAGTLGEAGCFSFYPGKNLGAYGEAGAVTTNSKTLADSICVFRDHGQTTKYHHSMIGWNARMDGFQGAVLSVKLKYLDEWTNRRRAHAKLYDALLADVDEVITPYESETNKHVYHIYPIRVKQRDLLLEELKKKGVYCGIHYPVPIHLTNAYESLGYSQGSFPVAEQCSSELLSLPMYAELNEDQIHSVVSALKELIASLEVTSISN